MKFKIPVENIPKLKAKLDKLNKVAKKLKQPEILVSYGNKETENKNGVVTEYQQVNVEGAAPKIAGWSFLGKIENNDFGMVVKSLPGKEVPEKYRHTNPNHCDHCKVNRYRTSLYILSNGSKTMQVGSACLEDFLGHTDPKALVGYAESLIGLEDEIKDIERDVRSVKFKYDTKMALEYAFAAIRKYGFTPSSATSKSTSSDIYDQFHPRKDTDTLSVSDDDRKNTEELIKHYQNKTPTTEFDSNVKMMLSSESIDSKYFPYLAAAAYLFMKHQIKKAANTIKVNETAIANVGDKITINAKVISAVKFTKSPSHYYDTGERQILILQDKDNHIIKLFTSNFAIEKGNEVEISGKIGSFEKEKYPNSPFYNKNVTTMAPRTKIKIL